MGCGSSSALKSVDEPEEDDSGFDDEDIREGWTMHRTVEGRVYYSNAETNESTWDPPDCWKDDAPDPLDGT